MYKLNRWYDGLQEPWRFLVFIVPMMGLIVIGSYGISHDRTWATLAGYVPMIGLLLMRVWYHYLRRPTAPKPADDCDERRAGLRVYQGGKR